MSLVDSKVREITNSLESFSKLEVGKNGIMRTIFTVADVKDYGTQMQEAISSGGASIDWMAFDTEKGAFVEHPSAPYVVDEMLEGKYRYLPESAKTRDLAKQTVRGMRAMLEMPWMSMKDSKIFTQDLAALLTEIQTKGITSKVQEQFDKMGATTY